MGRSTFMSLKKIFISLGLCTSLFLLVACKQNASGTTNRTNFGLPLINETNLKYKTIYPHNSENDTKENNRSVYNNSKTNVYGYGDAILETSTVAGVSTGWNGEEVFFPNTVYQFMLRGGSYSKGATSGMFALGYSGSGWYNIGFRAVLTPI